MTNNRKALVKSGIILLLYGHISHAVIDFNELKTQAIDSIKARADGLIELNDQDVLDTMKQQGFSNRLNKIVIKLRDLQAKAVEYETAGNTQANLYKAQAAMAEISMEALIYDVEANLATVLSMELEGKLEEEGLSFFSGSFFSLEDGQKKEGIKTERQAEEYANAEKYFNQVTKHRREIEDSFREARAVLDEAKAAQHGADEQQDLAEKYKKAADRAARCAARFK